MDRMFRGWQVVGIVVGAENLVSVFILHYVGVGFICRRQCHGGRSKGEEIQEKKAGHLIKQLIWFKLLLPCSIEDCEKESSFCLFSLHGSVDHSGARGYKLQFRGF